jgi:hypothetical protein
MKPGDVLDFSRYRPLSGPEPNWSDLDPLLFNRDLNEETVSEIRNKVVALRNAVTTVQEDLVPQGEAEEYVCKKCGLRNYGSWWKNAGGQVFRVCGSCKTVLEVR